MDLRNRNAVVIGAVSGIGLACVKGLLKNGVKKVAIVDYNESLFTEVATEITSEFGPNRVGLYKGDVTNETELAKVFKEVIKDLQKIDILHCNAGIIGEEIWQTVVDVNLKGVISGVLQGEAHMSKETGGQGGSIVLTSSVLGLSGMSCVPTYCATKHAVIGLARSYGTEEYFERTGIRVMAICPGIVSTPLRTTNLYQLDKKVTNTKLDDAFAGYIEQEPEVIADGVIQLLKNGNVGSIYVTEENKTFEIDMPCILKHTYKIRTSSE